MESGVPRRILALLAVTAMALSLGAASGRSGGPDPASCTSGASSETVTIVDGKEVVDGPYVSGCIPG